MKGMRELVAGNWGSIFQAEGAPLATGPGGCLSAMFEEKRGGVWVRSELWGAA